jgi:two-component system, NarL family, invasion response regulator UvrY
MINVFIVDDHTLIREGFGKIIEKEHDISIIGEAGNANDFLKKFDEHNCDLVVLDINLPDKNGLDVLKDIKSRNPETPVLIMSMYPEERYAIRTFQAGASGYISKDSAAEKLVKAIRKIMSGGKYVSKEFGQLMAYDLGHEWGGGTYTIIYPIVNCKFY